MIMGVFREGVVGIAACLLETDEFALDFAKFVAVECRACTCQS